VTGVQTCALPIFLNTSKHIVHEKRIEESIEGKDTLLLLFVANNSDIEWYNNFASLAEITSKFKAQLHEEETEENWLNTKWMGRALRRMALIKKKRRLGRGREVILDIDKAKDKAKMYEHIETESEKHLDEPLEKFEKLENLNERRKKQEPILFPDRRKPNPRSPHSPHPSAPKRSDLLDEHSDYIDSENGKEVKES